MKTRLIRLLFIFVLILCIGCTKKSVDTQAEEEKHESHVEECINDAMKHSRDALYYSYTPGHRQDDDSVEIYEIHTFSDTYIDIYLYTIIYDSTSNEIKYNRIFVSRTYSGRN